VDVAGGRAGRRAWRTAARSWPAVPVRLVLLGLLVPLAACGGTVDRPEKVTAAPSRSATIRHCPEAEVRPLPAGFRLVRRDLSSLGDNHMGQLKIYRDGRRQVQVFSGPDVYDKLDDMDLVPRRISLDGRTFEMWTTAVDRSLLVAQLDDDRPEAPCDNVGVLTRHVPLATFKQLLRDLTLRSPAAG